MSEKPSIQAIHQKRRSQNFVGRDLEIESFRRNLELPYEDRKYVWNVYGQGGIGKTTLLKRYLTIASEHRAVTALTDESQSDILDVMSNISDQFTKQGIALQPFAERHKVLRQLREQVESDPSLPSGLSTIMGKAVGKLGLAVARQIPLAGIAVDLIGEDNITEKMGDFVSYLSQRIGNKDEVRMLLGPVNVLTPLFIEGLTQITRAKQVVLAFDTFEKTRTYLDSWLQLVLEGKYGELDPDIVFVIAGREKLSNAWSDYIGLICSTYLDALTEKESRELLASRGVVDSARVELILKLDCCDLPCQGRRATLGPS